MTVVTQLRPVAEFTTRLALAGGAGWEQAESSTPETAAAIANRKNLICIL